MWKIQEDRPTPPEVYNARLYITAIIIAFGSMTYGYDGAFLGTTITQPSFQTKFGLATMDAGDRNNVSANIVSNKLISLALFNAGGFFGALFAWPSLEKLGRRPTMFISTLVFILGSILNTWGNNLAAQYAARTFTGLAVGGLTATTPSYTAEISVPSIRGRLVGFFEISYQLGAVVGFWINYGMTQTIAADSNLRWKIPMAVQLIPGGLLLIGIFFLKESPHFLYRAGRKEQALETLSYLRKLPSDHIYIQQEVAAIQAQIDAEQEVSGIYGGGFIGYARGALKEATQKGIRNRFFLTFMMFAWQAYSGAAAINYYSPTIFKSVGVGNPTLYTGIYGAIKAAGSIVFYIWFIDSWGRKGPWIWSCILCACCHFYLGGYGQVAHPSTNPAVSNSQKAGGKSAISAIMVFSVMWSFGANGLPWIISGEIYPVSIRAMSGSFTAMAITKSAPSIFSAMPNGAFFFLFGGILILAAIYGFLCIPETKGLRLEQMDELFGFTRHSTAYAHQVENPDVAVAEKFGERHSQKSLETV